MRTDRRVTPEGRAILALAAYLDVLNAEDDFGTAYRELSALANDLPRSVEESLLVPESQSAVPMGLRSAWLERLSDQQRVTIAHIQNTAADICGRFHLPPRRGVEALARSARRHLDFVCLPDWGVSMPGKDQFPVTIMFPAFEATYDPTIQTRQDILARAREHAAALTRQVRQRVDEAEALVPTDADWVLNPRKQPATIEQGARWYLQAKVRRKTVIGLARDLYRDQVRSELVLRLSEMSPELSLADTEALARKPALVLKQLPAATRHRTVETVRFLSCELTRRITAQEMNQGTGLSTAGGRPAKGKFASSPGSALYIVRQSLEWFAGTLMWERT